MLLRWAEAALRTARTRRSRSHRSRPRARHDERRARERRSRRRSPVVRGGSLSCFQDSPFVSCCRRPGVVPFALVRSQGGPERYQARKHRGRAFSWCLPSLLETHRLSHRFVLSSQDYVPFGTPHGRSALIGHRFDRPRAHRARRLCMLQIQIWR